MPRYGPFIHQVYIADGFADDCDELIHRCTRLERIDYQYFCKIWKDMNMGCAYEGRNLGAEIAELSEEMIHIAKHYMLKDTSNFEETAIGVFIVYALLHLQPYKGFAPLRLVPEDLTALNRIERVARRDKRYDVLYALGSVLIKGPVQYHAAEREYGMDLPVRKYLEGFTSIDKLGVRPKGVFRRQNEELDILKELHVITQRYTQAKMMISEKAQFDRSLQYINPNFPKELETALMKLITGIHEDKYGFLGEGSSSRSQSDDSSKVLKSRQAIKEKAMKQDVKPVRHLVELKNRKTSTITSGSLMKNNEAGPSKATTESSKYKITKDKNAVKAERKRRIPLSPRAVKRNCIKPKLKKNNDSTSESDESDSDVIELSEDDDVGVSIASSSHTTQATVYANKKGKGKKTMTATERKDEQSKEKKKEIKDEDNELTQNEETNDNTEDEQELDIEIDTLPVLIRTEEQGRLFEIEIIDHQTPVENLVNKTPVRTYKKKRDCPMKKINSLPGVSLEKNAEAPVESEPVPSTSTQLATLTEITEKSKNKEESAKPAEDKPVLGIPNAKVEKRDCKRAHIQSKLKRLGMLPIANFNVTEPERTEEDDSNDEPQKKGLARIED